VTQSHPSAGWYPDPNASGDELYFDGESWIARRRETAVSTRPNGASFTTAGTAQYAKVPGWAWTALAVLAMVVVVAVGTVWWSQGSSRSVSAVDSPTVSVIPSVPVTMPAGQSVTETPPLPPSPGPVVEQSAGCGPDEATAIRSALAVYPADPGTGWAWYSTPLASNYSPCADLSSVLVTIQRATGSSPKQALMFHRGVFLGTGTLKAYGFTTLDSVASTEDTVILDYRSGQSCTACGDGIVTTVRYHWDGARVQMLDPAPPD
jgi:hypothetical protein